MQQIVTVIRAIAAEYSRRVLKPITFIGISVLLLAHLLGAWLISMSGWWWLLEFVFIGLTLIFILVTTIIATAIRLTDTAQTAEQKQSVRQYVDKLERVAEHLQTPQPIIMFKIARDAVQPRPDGFIQTVSNDSKSLAPDYRNLQQRF